MAHLEAVGGTVNLAAEVAALKEHIRSDVLPHRPDLRDFEDPLILATLRVNFSQRMQRATRLETPMEEIQRGDTPLADLLIMYQRDVGRYRWYGSDRHLLGSTKGIGRLIVSFRLANIVTVDDLREHFLVPGQERKRLNPVLLAHFLTANRPAKPGFESRMSHGEMAMSNPSNGHLSSLIEALMGALYYYGLMDKEMNWLNPPYRGPGQMELAFPPPSEIT